MTVHERIEPDVIDGSRRTRIADGSGTSPTEVNNLVKQFKQMQKMLNNMGGMGTKRLKKGRKGKKGKKGGPGRKGGRPPGGSGRALPKGTKKPLVLPGLDDTLEEIRRGSGDASLN
jgi:signal recognition particle subunit SRP54